MKIKKAVLLIIAIITPFCLTAKERERYWINPKEKQLLFYSMENMLAQMFLGNKLGYRGALSNVESFDLNRCLNSDDSLLVAMAVETLMSLNGAAIMNGTYHVELILNSVREDRSIRNAVLVLDVFCKNKELTRLISGDLWEESLINKIRDVMREKDAELLVITLRSLLETELEYPLRDSAQAEKTLVKENYSENHLLNSVVTWIFLSEMQKRKEIEKGVRYTLENEDYRRSAIRWLAYIGGDDEEIVEIVMDWCENHITICNKPYLAPFVLGLIGVRAKDTDDTKMLIESLTQGTLRFVRVSESFESNIQKEEFKLSLLSEKPNISDADLNKLIDDGIGFGYQNKTLFKMGCAVQEYLTIRNMDRDAVKKYLLDSLSAEKIQPEDIITSIPAAKNILESKGRNQIKAEMARRFFNIQRGHLLEVEVLSSP